MLAVKILSPDIVEKIRYSINGVVLSHVTDTAEGGIIIRNSGENQLIIKENKVISIMLLLQRK